MASYHEIHREIIELSKAGNSKAQKQLYQLYAKAMFNICYRMMNNHEEAEDMLQESFTEAFLKLDTFRFESSFGAWLKRITINKCINTLKKRRTSLIAEEHLPDRSSDEVPDEEIPGLTVNRIQKAMQQLPEGYRVVFSLYILEGYDHGEISQILGISEATSKSQYSRAKKRIKELLKK
ncbi:MAG: RNA polymerase sigma factor [Bacteroidales bacterium]|nr:RNA polymerase sigma factor [Bacteroidales bacterium]